MDDINSTINAILGDPAKMQQLRSMAESLGINTGNASPPVQHTSGNAGQGAGGIDPGAISALLQNFQNAGGNQNSSSSGNAASSLPALDGISKITGLMSSFNQSDKNMDLLRALKPHFSAARAGKIDDAVRIMQLMRMWPVLRDSGILGNLGNLFSGGGGK
ncbi:hypothetical protein V6615_15785 [Oscillospiraceae bacterium PP1C4]